MVYSSYIVSINNSTFCVNRVVLPKPIRPKPGTTIRLLAIVLALLTSMACGGGGGMSGGHAQFGARLSSSSLSFGSQGVSISTGVQTVSVTSTGILNLVFTSVAVTGTNAGE